jgi:hypothetical protein
MPARASRTVPDCNEPAIYNTFIVHARSSVDRKVYGVQICAILDSAEGEDFRTEAK